MRSKRNGCILNDIHLPGNFKSVKRGKFDDYSIRKYQSNVVADNFKFGTDKNVVVALEQDVFMVNKKHLQKVVISVD